MLKWRNPVCVVLVCILPSSLLAQESGRAMLHSRRGNVSLNHATVPISQVLMPDDSVQTEKDSIATIDAYGSTATMDSETVVQFEGDELDLDHGSLAVVTSRGMKVHVDCVTVTPVNPEWTQYTVVNVDGKVHITAVKNDVYLESRSSNRKQAKNGERSEREIVHEGEEKTRDERCGAGIIEHPEEAHRPFFNTPEARIGGGILIISGCIWVYCLGSSDPISPTSPSYH